MLEKQLKPAGGPKGINKKYVFMFSLNYSFLIYTHIRSKLNFDILIDRSQ